jgi:O-methyltransferase
MTSPSKPDLASLYLDLMKKALSFALWEERWVPVRTAWYKPRYVFGLLPLLARCAGLQLVRAAASDRKAVEEGRFWPQQADTMIGLKRLDNIQSCVESALADGIGGDFIETGVWRGAPAS